MSTDEGVHSQDDGPIRGSTSASLAKSWGLGIIGAAIGGLVSWGIYDWLLSQGFYALALPGAALGFGFAAMAKRPMLSGGVFCAVAAFFLICLLYTSPSPRD